MNQGNLINSDQDSSAKTLSMVVYGLQIASFISGFTIFIAIIINYIKMDDVRGTPYESHFKWQIRTFWYTFIGLAISIPLCFVLIGYFFIVLISIWFLYRVIKGFLNLIDGKSMYRDEVF